MSYVCQPGDKADRFAAAAAEVVRDYLALPKDMRKFSRDNETTQRLAQRYDAVLAEFVPQFWDTLPSEEEGKFWFAPYSKGAASNFLNARDAGAEISESFVPVVIATEVALSMPYLMTEMPFYLNEFAPRYRAIIMA